MDYEEMVNLYLDLLAILEGNLCQEVGMEIDNIISRSLDKLSAQSKTLIGDLDLARDARETTVKDIAERLTSQGSGAEGRLFLQSSFNKLVFLLIMNMKDILGVNLTEKTIKEMMNILEYVEKYRQDTGYGIDELCGRKSERLSATDKVLKNFDRQQCGNLNPGIPRRLSWNSHRKPPSICLCWSFTSSLFTYLTGPERNSRAVTSRWSSS
ncbi:MAG: hypothetical protein JRJ51_06325 [Deltaproteobacteria bacterium]|nr:hypothetical protein [Deltaproteobacteria bacterium]